MQPSHASCVIELNRISGGAWCGWYNGTISEHTAMSKYLSGAKYRTKLRIPHDRIDPLARKKQNALIVMVIAAAIFAVLVTQQRLKQPKNVPPSDEVKENAPLSSSPIATRALEYIKAVQERGFEKVFQMTQWMHDRVALIRNESDAEAADRDVESFYQQEKRNFFAEGVGGPMTDEGISDAHLFPPGAVVRVVGVEEGVSRPVLDKREPLDKVLVEVEYPETVTAPVDDEGRRIKKVRAALYLNRDGRIIKASVRGNTSVEATARSRRTKKASTASGMDPMSGT